MARFAESLVAGLGLGPVMLLALRLVARRLSPEADPVAMLDVERSHLVSVLTTALLATALATTGAAALLPRRPERRARAVQLCFALGALGALAGVGFVR